MGTILPQTIVSAWWRQTNTRTLVLTLTVLAALDSGYTLMWIGQRGLAGEANPLIKALFEAGLGPLWGVANVSATFLGAVLLGSCIVVLPERARAYPVLGMSLLAALKVVLGLYHLIQFYDILQVTWILWITAVVTFVLTRRTLDKGRLIDWEEASRSIRELRNDLSTFIIMSRAPKARSSLETEVRPTRVSQPGTTERTSALRNWRLFFWIGVIILAPILALSLVQVFLQMSGVLDLPRWMRGLGMVSEEQGRLFIVTLVTMFLTIAVLIYGIVTVFEILSNESGRRKRESRRRAGGKVSSRLVVLALLLVVASMGVPAALAAMSEIQSATGPSTQSSAGEVAAAADSNGRVHAAWVEKDYRSPEPGSVDLWYSTYDPESTNPRGVRRVDHSTSIYSLGMTIDELDNVHMIWVRRPAETLNESQTLASARRLDGVYYLRIESGETPSESPKLLLDLEADSVWTSITSGRDSQLYVVWSEAVRLNSTVAESTTYCSRLSATGEADSFSPMLVARTVGSSKMLKSAAGPDQDSLYLSWIQELSNGTSLIMYSRIDHSQNAAVTLNVQRVNGLVGRLTLTATRGGDVLIGWTYQEPTKDAPVAGLTRLSREGDATSEELEIPSRRLSDLESMTVDSEGNLHLLWMDLSDDLRAMPRSVPLSQASFYHARLDSSTRSSEEKLELSYLPVVTAFVLENGQVYIVSQQGILRAAEPFSANNSMLLLLALSVSGSAIAGIGTEAGTYQVARWMTRPLWRRRKEFGGSPSDLDSKLLRSIRRKPGVTLSELKSVVRLGMFDLASSLSMLEASGTVQSLREGMRQRFYCLTSAFGEGCRADELRQDILGLVETQPGIGEAEIARHLDLSQQLANYHLKVLSEAKLLSSVRTGSRVNYFANEWYRKHATK